MYYTGIDPFTGEAVYVAKQMRDRRMQRALLQFFKPENYFEVRRALVEAGRADLIGGGCDALIPATPPPEALRVRQEKANAVMKGDHYHAVPTPGKKGGKGPRKKGYRPGRKSAGRQERRGQG
jgi:hypothetical protein